MDAHKSCIFSAIKFGFKAVCFCKKYKIDVFKPLKLKPYLAIAGKGNSYL